MILFFIFIIIVIFFGWIFYVEYEVQKDLFLSIFVLVWFVIVLLINVGYGDMVFVIIMGKVLGVFCILVGVLVIVLLSFVIVMKFCLYYEKKKRRNFLSYKFQVYMFQ